jgi:hypothetical protein
MQNDRLIENLNKAIELSKLKAGEMRALMPLVSDADVKSDLAILTQMLENPRGINEELLKKINDKYNGVNGNKQGV